MLGQPYDYILLLIIACSVGGTAIGILILYFLCNTKTHRLKRAENRIKKQLKQANITPDEILASGHLGTVESFVMIVNGKVQDHKDWNDPVVEKPDRVIIRNRPKIKSL